MKVMFLCYDDEKHWQRVGEATLREAMNQAVGLTHELHAQGKYLLASPLQHSHTAKTVRVRDGKRVVTDGPFAETREVLGGFYLLDVKDMDEAIAFAARHPGVFVGAVEIRPVIELEGLPQVK